MSLLSRWNRRPSLSSSSSLREEVPPPSLRCTPDSGWHKLIFWLLAPAPQEAAPPFNRLPGVRREFLGALADIESAEAEMLRGRIHDTRSLRELWHLRAEAYRLVGVAHSQNEAEERLSMLNRHFPSRAPRSQLAQL